MWALIHLEVVCCTLLLGPLNHNISAYRMRTSEGVLALYKLEIENLSSKLNLLQVEVEHYKL